MLPAGLLLLVGGSWFAKLMGAVYVASMLSAMAYHWHLERRFVGLDHALAWAVIGCNSIMCLETTKHAWSLGGIVLVAVALDFYRQARRGEHYDAWHSLWHLTCGAAGWCFARGYLG